VHIYADAFALSPHTTRSIGRGFVVLLGVAQGDTEAQADRIVDKTIGLRVFADAEAKMNLDLRQVGGALLVVSQFTLLADTRKGRRPSFIDAAAPETGEALYHYVVQRLRAAGFTVEMGEFGAHMVVEIANDGPVTILLDTDQM
jgi:D-tyrosyl-tRNA(Tyr) deacylase